MIFWVVASDPAGPTGFSETSADTTSLTVGWDADPNSVMSGWRVYYRERGTDTWTPQDVAVADGPQVTVDFSSDGSDAGKTYEVKVRAVTGTAPREVESEDSDVLQITLSKFIQPLIEDNSVSSENGELVS